MPERDRRLIQHPEEFRFKFDANSQLVNTLRRLMSLDGNTWLDKRPAGLQFVSEYAHLRIGTYAGTIDEMEQIAQGYQGIQFDLARAARIGINPSTERVRLGINVRLPEERFRPGLKSRLKELDDHIAPHGHIKLFVMLPPHSLKRIPAYSTERLLKNCISANSNQAHGVSMSTQLHNRQLESRGP